MLLPRHNEGVHSAVVASAATGSLGAAYPCLTVMIIQQWRGHRRHISYRGVWRLYRHSMSA